jgi:hypothetical protein
MNGGIMKRYGVAILAIAALFLLPAAVLCQEGGSGPDTANTPTTTDTPVNPFTPGEQMLLVSAGLHIPAFILPDAGTGVSNLQLGGSFSFGYQYFLLRGLSLGGNIAGAFNGTIGGFSVFTMPFGVTGSYWWSKLPFEFELQGEAGGYLMRYNNKGMVAPFAKGGMGVFWRATGAWSLGLQANLWFIPELHYGSYTDLNRYAGFVETSITAIYHL